MSEILLKRGFELSIGFMHHSETSKTYWNMLSFDFIEPFRVLIDNTVKEMIDKNGLLPDDFTFSDDKSRMIFKDNAFKIALQIFIDTLEPLEHKSLPLIRKIGSVLIFVT